MHLCWGNYPGPHHCDVPLADIIDLVWTAKPRAILFEAANPRHAHEWTLFERVKVPDDKVLCPGVIECQSNYIEHPEVVAQRIERYARLVGRERVMAGVDCGFSIHAGMQGIDPRRGLGQARSAGKRRGDRDAEAVVTSMGGRPMRTSALTPTVDRRSGGPSGMWKLLGRQADRRSGHHLRRRRRGSDAAPSGSRVPACLRAMPTALCTTGSGVGREEGRQREHRAGDRPRAAVPDEPQGCGHPPCSGAGDRARRPAPGAGVERPTRWRPTTRGAERSTMSQVVMRS